MTPPPTLAPAQRSFWLRPPIVVLVLIALWAFSYLPDLGARDLRLEEGRRATPAWEMLHTGDYVVPRLYGEIYLSKPPFYFWLVAGTKALFGGIHDENATRWHWAVRFPSAVGALLGALILLAFARRTLPWHTRILAALAWLATATLLDKGTLGEIDALLSSLVLASLALWFQPFDRDPHAAPSFTGWLGAGLLMAIAILLKGPGGPLQFYPTIILFMLWQIGLRKTFRILRSPGHALFILLAILPALAWVALLMSRTGLSVHDLLHIWGEQTGLDEIGVMHAQDPSERFAWSRYATFLPDVFSMTLPWSLWAIPALFPPVARWAGLLPDRSDRSPSPPWAAAYRFAAAGILGITAIFYAYPGAQARHMMAVAFPVTLMAALLITAPAVAEKWRALAPAFATAAGIMTLIPAIAGLVALAASIFLSKAHGLIPIGATIAAIGLVITIVAAWAGKRIPATSLATWVGATLALTVLAGRAAVAAVFLPVKAPSDITAIDQRQIDTLISPTLPAYTTKTFTTRRGNGYYNILFYIHLRTAATGGLHAIPPAMLSPPPPAPGTASASHANTQVSSTQDVAAIPSPCTLIGSPDEIAGLAARLRSHFDLQGHIGVPGRQPPPIDTGILSLYKDGAARRPTPATTAPATRSGLPTP